MSGIQITNSLDQTISFKQTKPSRSLTREPEKKRINETLGESVVNENNKISLKMELLELNSDRFNTIRHQVRTANLRNIS